MVIAMSADHGGYELKQVLVACLSAKGHQVLDFGPSCADAIDYPDKAREVTAAVVNKEAEVGILVCGSGTGMSIAANRVSGIRAVLASSEEYARLGRAHNNGNVLCLGARMINQELALCIVDVFLATPFEGGRHQRRIEKLESMC